MGSLSLLADRWKCDRSGPSLLSNWPNPCLTFPKLSAKTKTGTALARKTAAAGAGGLGTYRNLMEWWLIAVFIAAGAMAGTLAGLMGLGGGILYVPVLVYSLEGRVSPSELPLVAVSTSLLVISFSILSSALTHWQKGNLDLSPLLPLVVGGAVGALLASLGLAGLPTKPFKILLGLFELFVAAQLIHTSKKAEPPEHNAGFWVYGLIGFCGGGVSAFFGVGGGLVVMPLMHFLAGYKIAKAVGTASVFMIFATLLGLGFHSFQPITHSDLPGIWHNFYLPGFFALLPTAFVFNRVGALWAAKINPAMLKRALGLVILPLGLVNLINGLVALL